MTATGYIDQENSLLTIGELTQHSAVLLLHANRVLPFLWETAIVNDHRPVRLPKVCGHQLLMSFQNSIIVPSPFADKLLDGSVGRIFQEFESLFWIVLAQRRDCDRAASQCSSYRKIRLVTIKFEQAGGALELWAGCSLL
jgi:hypothetical protein